MRPPRWRRRCRSSGQAPTFQAGNAGSIPVTRSADKRNRLGPSTAREVADAQPMLQMTVMETLVWMSRGGTTERAASVA
jgi:hypothetical protein